MAPVTRSQRRDWQALPYGILQHIFGGASTWQFPGSCLAATVCRTWKAAAAGCRGIRLLYHAGHEPADQLFAAWLGQRGVQLESLTLSGDYSPIILEPLAEAAAAARAAGQPLRLHTLRALGPHLPPELVGQLVAALPHLRCLQVEVAHPRFPGEYRLADALNKLKEALGPLQQATQLEELYLKGAYAADPSMQQTCCAPRLLLPNLKRLSWQGHDVWCTLNLSHLTRVTFLQLSGWREWTLDSEDMPPGLEELQVFDMQQELSAKQQQAVTRWQLHNLSSNTMMQLQQDLPNLTAADIGWGQTLDTPAAQAALAQLAKLSALCCPMPLQPGLAALGSMRALRRLHLGVSLDPPKVSGLSALTGVTQLVLSAYNDPGWESAHAVAAEISTLAGLQWLSVPHALLRAQQGWLGHLRQLRVLVLDGYDATAHWGTDQHTDAMPWLEEGSLQAAPSSLRVVRWSGVPADMVAAWQLRRRLRQMLGSSGCEVVVGVDLNRAADPTQQLAGLPEGLQRVLA